MYCGSDASKSSSSSGSSSGIGSSGSSMATLLQPKTNNCMKVLTNGNGGVAVVGSGTNNTGNVLQQQANAVVTSSLLSTSSSSLLPSSLSSLKQTQLLLPHELVNYPVSSMSGHSTTAAESVPSASESASASASASASGSATGSGSRSSSPSSLFLSSQSSGAPLFLPQPPSLAMMQHDSNISATTSTSYLVTGFVNNNNNNHQNSNRHVILQAIPPQLGSSSSSSLSTTLPSTTTIGNFLQYTPQSQQLFVHQTSNKLSHPPHSSHHLNHHQHQHHHHLHHQQHHHPLPHQLETVNAASQQHQSIAAATTTAGNDTSVVGAVTTSILDDMDDVIDDDLIDEDLDDRITEQLHRRTLRTGIDRTTSERMLLINNSSSTISNSCSSSGNINDNEEGDNINNNNNNDNISLLNSIHNNCNNMNSCPSNSIRQNSAGNNSNNLKRTINNKLVNSNASAFKMPLLSFATTTSSSLSLLSSSSSSFATTSSSSSTTTTRMAILPSTTPLSSSTISSSSSALRNLTGHTTSETRLSSSTTTTTATTAADARIHNSHQIKLLNTKTNKLNKEVIDQKDINDHDDGDIDEPMNEPVLSSSTVLIEANHQVLSQQSHGLVDPDAVGALEEAEPEPEIDIVINNVVCSFSVRCHLNLRDIALNGFNVEFRRENGMVTMKLRRPYTTASIWSSGRITCTGATSEDQAKVAARRYARCLQKLGFSVKLNNFRVVNVLGTCSMPWAIKIVNFSEKYKKDASYEPELHPGVTYKLKTPKATLKIFSTGSITVTAPSVAFVQAAIEHIFPLVYEFRKKRPVKELVVINKPMHIGNLDAELPITMDDNLQATGTKRRRPFGKADNDPDDDIMYVSDTELDEEDGGMK